MGFDSGQRSINIPISKELPSLEIYSLEAIFIVLYFKKEMKHCIKKYINSVYLPFFFKRILRFLGNLGLYLIYWESGIIQSFSVNDLGFWGNKPFFCGRW